jgi:hybrid cluster-associated redox disulfide protein
MNNNKLVITKDMTIAELLKLKPQAGQVLISKGMHCLGCVVAHGETIEQAVGVHGLDLVELLKEINEV